MASVGSVAHPPNDGAEYFRLRILSQPMSGKEGKEKSLTELIISISLAKVKTTHEVCDHINSVLTRERGFASGESYDPSSWL